jgi:uncharacterized protein involved in cysteine biosynthesis
MTNFHPRNYKKNNSPKWAQKIGDLSLTAGVIGAAILSIPTIAPIVLPVAVTSLAGWLLGIGTIGKAAMKCFGVELKEKE